MVGSIHHAIRGESLMIRMGLEPLGRREGNEEGLVQVSRVPDGRIHRDVGLVLAPWSRFW